jgi:hypothetical protein
LDGSRSAVPDESAEKKMKFLNFIFYFLGHWYGDGTTASTTIVIHGSDLDTGVRRHFEEFKTATETERVVEYKAADHNGAARNVFLLRLGFTGDASANCTTDDPLWEMLCALGCSDNGDKRCTPLHCC